MRPYPKWGVIFYFVFLLICCSETEINYVNDSQHVEEADSMSIEFYKNIAANDMQKAYAMCHPNDIAEDEFLSVFAELLSVEGALLEINGVSIKTDVNIHNGFTYKEYVSDWMVEYENGTRHEFLRMATRINEDGIPELKVIGYDSKFE